MPETFLQQHFFVIQFFFSFSSISTLNFPAPFLIRVLPKKRTVC